MAEGISFTDPPRVPLVDSRGRTIDEVEPAKVYIDKTRHKLVVGNQLIDITNIPFSEDTLPEEQKYIEALLAAYADKNGLSSLTIEELKKNYFIFYEDLRSQRRFFFDASSVFHAVRDSFVNGEDELTVLKDEAFDGIREVYLSDYSDGYARLNAVLSKITSTTFDKTELKKFTKLIGNSEKKGICHMLVEDGRLSAWVIHM